MRRERWKVIKGFETAYEVSTFGRIKSLRRIDALGHLRKERIRAIHPGTKHQAIDLHLNGTCKWVNVHRVVLETFVGPAPLGTECRHLDGDPTNNHLSNLCWGTRIEQKQDSRKHGTLPYGSAHYKAKLTERDVRAIRSVKYAKMSCAALARKYNVTDVTISYIRLRRTWKHV